MEQQKFSVAMCVYGGDDPDWFRAAADSVLNQTCPPSEVVLVVDGPVPEELAEVIRTYEKRPDFRVLWEKENKGHGNARRLSLEHCTCDLVALMDADDISVPERFALQLEALSKNPQADIVGGMITEFIGTPDHRMGVRKVPLRDVEIKEYMKTRCPMNQVTVMFKKDSVVTAGGYLDWHYNEDYYLWIRMYLAGMSFCNVEDTLVYVRVGEDMYRRRGGIKYFKSEARLQKYMLEHRVIGIGTYLLNVGKRLILQVLMPNRLRGWVFRKFARSG